MNYPMPEDIVMPGDDDDYDPFFREATDLRQDRDV